jgi:uncharacterized protein with von Willebrand factor type A (vWA) domain
VSYRYGTWHGGPDPLAPPFDTGGALDRMAERILGGERPSQALANLLRRGLPGARGLDDLLRRARERRRQLRARPRMDGTLEQVRELLEKALEQERAALFPDPADAARLAEAELDQLPDEVASAVRELADYRWRSPQAAATYERIRDLLRREVLDAQFRGMKQALEEADPAAMQRVKDMLTDLNALLDADARGQDTSEAFERFMGRYGDMFPDQPRTLDELVDSLARRAAAASRMLASLSPEQRQELTGLVQQAMQDLGLADELERLAQALRWRRPELGWDQEAGQGQAGPSGQPLGMGDATSALEELADLEGLARALAQDYPGASLEDIDPEALERALGRAAVDDLEALKALERELTEQGWVTRDRGLRQGELRLTPKAIRRIGAAALARIFRSLTDGPRRVGDHEVPAAGLLGEPTGTSRPWRFGDEQPIDVVATVRNAVRRQGATRTGVTLTVDDFEVIETERRTTAAVSLLVDLSYSMVLREAWAGAKATALALHSLATTTFPQDALQIVGFSALARELRPGELAELAPDMVQGTNLQHALMLAGRHLARHPEAEPVVLVVTDGEPTAHLTRDGSPLFDWPPLPETLELTMAEVLRLTRMGATVNVFMLDDEPRLVRFVQGLARVNGGRVFTPASDQLGDYVVSDYLRARRGARGRRR